MRDRVVRLETHFQYIRRDLDELKANLSQVLTAVRELPTKNDLWSWRVQWTAICVAAIALIVGGIIGGLSWVKPESVTVPIVVNTVAPPDQSN